MSSKMIVRKQKHPGHPVHQNFTESDHDEGCDLFETKVIFNEDLLRDRQDEGDKNEVCKVSSVLH